LRVSALVQLIISTCSRPKQEKFGNKFSGQWNLVSWFSSVRVRWFTNNVQKLFQKLSSCD